VFQVDAIIVLEGSTTVHVVNSFFLFFYPVTNTFIKCLRSLDFYTKLQIDSNQIELNVSTQLV